MTKLRKAREASGLTLEELAEQVGSSKSYMWQIENKDDPQPTVRMAYQLSRILNVPVQDLFNVELKGDTPNGNYKMVRRDQRL